jgi:hypothetical protein
VKKTTTNTASPPSTSPTSSSTLNNFGSDWRCTYAPLPGGGYDGVQVVLDYAPAAEPPGGTLLLKGTAVCGLPDLAAGDYTPGQVAVFDVDMKVTGVRRADPDPLECGSYPCSQVVQYSASLTDPVVPGAVSGVLTLNVPLTESEAFVNRYGLPVPRNNQNLNYKTWVIDLGAKQGDPPGWSDGTTDLCTGVEQPACSAAPYNNPPGSITFPPEIVAGVALGANEVLKFFVSQTFPRDPANDFPTNCPGCGSGVPTNSDNAQAVWQSVNNLLGLGLTSNAGVAPLLLTPDYLWRNPGVPFGIGIVAVSAGNSNVLGWYGEGGVCQPLLTQDGAFSLLSAPYRGVEPLPLPETFGWCLVSTPSNAPAGTTFYSDPALNADAKDHLLAYTLATPKDPKDAIVALNTDGQAGGDVCILPQFLLGWEDLLSGGDADYNDVQYVLGPVVDCVEPTVVAIGPAPLGVEGPDTLPLRHCHSHSLNANDPADCVREIQPGVFALSTGEVAALTPDAACPNGDAGGLIDVADTSRLADFTWSGLDCGGLASQAEFKFGNGQQSSVGGGTTPLRIHAEKGTLFTVAGSTGYGVNGPGDKGGAQKLIEGDESLVFELDSSELDKLNAFQGVELRFWVGKGTAQRIAVSATNENGGSVGVEVNDQSCSTPCVVTVAADPKTKAISAPLRIAAFGATKLVFKADGNSAFGVAGGLSFGTRVAGEQAPTP